MNQKKESFEGTIYDLNLPDNIVTKLKSKELIKIEDILLFTEKELKSLKGIGPTTVNVLKLALKIKKLSFRKEVKEKDPNLHIYKEAINKFLGWKIKEINYGSELRVAKRVFDLNPKFLDIDLGFKINSLAYFLTFNGKKTLLQSQNTVNPVAVREIVQNSNELEEYKLGEDIVIERKKSIRDFLNE